MLPRLPSRAGLLVALLTLGLLVPGFDAHLTRADPLPAPCALTAAAADLDEAAVDDLLLLSAILPAEADPGVAAAPSRPTPGAPLPPGRGGAPKPPGTDLRPPDPTLLTLEPIVAARQLRASLTEQQQGDLRALLAKHQGALQHAQTRLPTPPGEPTRPRPAQAAREATPGQAAADVQRIADQLDPELEALLTPAQRALLHKARPKRLRSALPAPPLTGATEDEPDC